MDTGQTDLLLHNAAALQIDLSDVDTVILSHGHYDHTGGVLPLYGVDPSFDLYMRRGAAEPHYNGERYIGIDSRILSLPRLHLVDGDLMLDDELFLFGGYADRFGRPSGNRTLTVERGGSRTADDFAHEQSLVLTQNGKRWLLSGCAHSGILNILDRYHELFGSSPDYVVSGFHMMKRDGIYTDEEKASVRQTAETLSKLPTVFYTGHCTGEPAFALMREIMGPQLIPLHSGSEIC
jgi:7,8-dihydropterin-6-yl-methyl-4-(beta-D-ribofuranosyl)aminobenzene 5'-phosphate synthase